MLFSQDIHTIDQDMPGHIIYPLDGGDVCGDLTCSYCKLMLRDPVQTTVTGHRLCRGCFDAAQKYVMYRKWLAVFVFSIPWETF